MLKYRTAIDAIYNHSNLSRKLVIQHFGTLHPNLDLAADILARRDAEKWQPIETAPKNEMFIWATPNGPGKFSLGLAYRNVSGGWSDAYGAETKGATHWMPLPPPPITR